MKNWPPPFRPALILVDDDGTVLGESAGDSYIPILKEVNNGRNAPIDTIQDKKRPS